MATNQTHTEEFTSGGQHPNISGHRACEVLDVLRRASTGEKLPQDIKIGLLIEGGSLRGVLSCNYGISLSRLAPAHIFSEIMGASSGALNAVYFATQQLELAHSIYVSNATDKRCTNPWRFPNVLDVDWLIDNWLFGEKKFNQRALERFPGNVTIVLTDLQTGKPLYFDAKASQEAQLRQAMKATAYSPLLTSSSQQIFGATYGDGAISDSIPYHEAVRRGCSHIVCLVTRPSFYRKRKNVFVRTLERLRLIGHSGAYLDRYFKRAEDYNEVLDTIYGARPAMRPTLVIHPKNSNEVPGSIETRPAIIEQLGLTARQLSHAQLEHSLR